MATRDQIDQHDQLMAQLALEFGEGLEPLFQQFFDDLSAIPDPTREQIQREFQRFRTYLRENVQNIQAVVESNVAMNAGALGESVTPNQAAVISRLEQEILASVDQTLDETQNQITSAIVMGAVAGGVAANTINDLRTATQSRQRTITNTFNNAVRNFDGAVSRVRADQEQRYEYVGGVIAESRDFCRSLDGARMTESEIRDTWASEDWQGKEPGDPFVVRGGYNCRHMWVPIEEDE
jgi:hypothetical protein